MARKKLLRILATKKIKRIISPQKAVRLRGSWNGNFFGNDNRLILELGCGRGEYALGISKADKRSNVIGIDKKADRLWCAAKEADRLELANLAFIHGKIELIDQYFCKSEISGIWITFPDPHPKNPGRRLTAPDFLAMYRQLLADGATIKLKTDERKLYQYTLDVLQKNEYKVLVATADLYSSSAGQDKMNRIETCYENKHISEGDKICYICFASRVN